MSKGVFIGLTGAVFACLFSIGFRVYRPSIERDLATRTRKALEKHDIRLKSTQFSGRDGEIRLVENAPQNRQLAARIADRVFGVRVARVLAEETSVAEALPHFQVERIGENLRLSGALPNEAIKQSLETAARNLFDGVKMQSTLEVRSGVASPAYLNSLVPLLGLLSRTAPEGQLELLGKNLRLSGEVPDALTKASLETRARDLLPFGLELTVALRAPQEMVVEARQVAKDLQREIESARLNFEYDSTEISPASVRQLEPVVEVARDLSGFEIRITGHTDSKGSEAYNLALSKKRAAAIAKIFVENGVTAKLHMDGQGERKPVSDNQTEKGRAENRRVDFQVMGGG